MTGRKARTLSRLIESAKRGPARYGLMLLLDLVSVVLAYYLALLLRFAGSSPLRYLPPLRSHVLAVAALYCLSNALFGLYDRLWRYASSEEIIPIVESAAVATAVLAALDVLTPGVRPIPLSVVLAGGLLAMGGFAVARYGHRVIHTLLWRLRAARRSPEGRMRVLIVGAGEAGQMLTYQLLSQEQGASYRVVGLVDDDPTKHGLLVHGVRVLGGREVIPAAVRAENVDLIVIAIQTLAAPDLREILSICMSTPARIKRLPGVFQRFEDSRESLALRDLGIEDLVGRDQVSIDRQACRQLLAGKCVLVTARPVRSAPSCAGKSCSSSRVCW